MARDPNILIRNYMRNHAEQFRDNCGEVNHTALAEACADELDMYEDTDYTIPEVLFEISAAFT